MNSVACARLLSHFHWSNFPFACNYATISTFDDIHGALHRMFVVEISILIMHKSSKWNESAPGRWTDFIYCTRSALSLSLSLKHPHHRRHCHSIHCSLNGGRTARDSASRSHNNRFRWPMNFNFKNRFEHEFEIVFGGDLHVFFSCCALLAISRPLRAIHIQSFVKLKCNALSLRLKTEEWKKYYPKRIN